MKPRFLKIEGFLSYRQPVEIDFTDWDLACITGDNGAGKSSILDAITWALFGKARQTNEDLINLQSDKASVSFSFEYSGESYKVKRSNTRGKPGRLTFKTPEVDLTERTTRQTQEKIERILSINYDTFINAVFFLQGESDQFLASTPGQRKKVLFDILGLDAWEEYRLAARAKMKGVEGEIASLRGATGVIDENLQDPEILENDLEEAQISLTNLNANVKASREKLAEQQKIIDEYQTVYDQIQKSIGNVMNLKTKKDDTESRLNRIQSDLEKYQKIIDRGDQIKSDYGRHQELTDRVEKLSVAGNQYNQLTSEVGVLESQMKAILKEKAKIPALERELEKWGDLAGSNFNIKLQLDEHNEDLTGLRMEIQALETKAENLAEQIQGLNGHDVCPLCQQDLGNPDELMDKLQNELGETLKAKDRKASKAPALKRDIQDLKDRLQKAENAKTKVIEINSQIAQIHQKEEDFDIATLDHKRECLAGIDFDGGDLAESKRALNGLKDAPKNMGMLESASEAMEGLLQQETDFKKDLENYEKEISALEKEIHDLQDSKIVNIQEIETHKARLQQQLEASTNEANDITKKIGTIEKTIEYQKAQKQKMEEMGQAMKELENDLAEYSILHEAFSKKGIPALLVEESLPSIENEANQILSRLSDGKMAIHFVTQKAYADASRDDMKETLDVEIQDQAGIRSYEMYSGGESFRINFAVRIALSHVLANRAGAKLRTLVIDEGFGSQDAAGRDKLINAINVIKSDYDKVLVITHIPELIESFPVQLRVEKSLDGSKVRIL